MYEIAVSAQPTDGLTLIGARISAGTVMLVSRIWIGPSKGKISQTFSNNSISYFPHILQRFPHHFICIFLHFLCFYLCRLELEYIKPGMSHPWNTKCTKRDYQMRSEGKCLAMSTRGKPTDGFRAKLHVFLDRTTLHGAYYLGQTNFHWLRR